MNIQERLVTKIMRRNERMTERFEIIPNPDFIFRKEVEEAIKANDGYCCCALKKSEDTKCMCKAFREQQTYGFCNCGRYLKVLKCPKVCLCGSTRFKEKFFEVAREFTMKGAIVTMPLVFVHRGDVVDELDKDFLDEVHKAKIADADLIYIINQNGYIGESTQSEIDWAEMLGKKIEYLEPQI